MHASQWWWVWAVCACASPPPAERALCALWGPRALNRASVCAAGAEPCAAALWAPRWAVARASCLTPAHTRLLRHADGLSCDDLIAGAGGVVARRVLSTLAYPQPASGPPLDLTLLQLDRPYSDLEPLANETADIYDLLKPFSSIVNAEKLPLQDLWVRRHSAVMLSTPLRMFMTTTLLPLLTFMALFMFIIFCTGQDPSNPYKSLDKCEETSA